VGHARTVVDDFERSSLGRFASVARRAQKQTPPSGHGTDGIQHELSQRFTQRVHVDMPRTALTVNIDQDIDPHIDRASKEIGEIAEKRQHLHSDRLEGLAPGE